jgi:hypothetical protein
MKKLKKIFQVTLVALYSICYMNTSQAQQISNHFFGENAWMPDTIGNASACTDPPCILNGKLHQEWGNIKNSSASIIRFGGTAPDKNMPTNYQYIRMIDSIRMNGMEPVIQVPFFNYRYTEAQAADIVHYINVVKGEHVKYWIIGNEPNLGYSYSNSSQIAAYFKPFASAMKNVDPSILIIGPEIAWFQQDIIDGLTTPNGPDDITGKDAAGRYYLDIISFHTYPFSGTQTRTQVISKLTSANSLQDNLAYLKTRIAACNTVHSRTGTSALKTAITEANVAYQNSATDNLNGVGTNSFIGGQFISELLGIAMKNGVDFVNLWSVIEGNSIASDIGFIDHSTLNKKPSYYHFKLMADNFKGNYVDGTSNQPDVKVFGSQSSGQISVLVLNEDQTNNYNFTVRLNTTTIPGSTALKININAGLSQEYSDVITNQSSTLLRFDAAGNILEKTEYKLSGNADANLPPTVTVLSTTTGIVSNDAKSSTNFEIKTFPNPTQGKFTIGLDGDNSRKEEFDIEIYNLVGQIVISKKSTFPDGKEEVELDPSVANGTYILRVKKGNLLMTKKILLVK